NQYAKDLQASLNQFGSLTDAVLARAKSPPPDAVTLVEDLKQAERMAALEASEERDAQKWAERFGPGFRGVATDWNALRKALGWVLRVRELFERSPRVATRGLETALPSPEFVQLAGAGPVAGGAAREVRQAHDQPEQALH